LDNSKYEVLVGYIMFVSYCGNIPRWI
jgi:hypothetical protein